MLSPADFPNSGIEPGSPVLQGDTLLIELSGKPLFKKPQLIPYYKVHVLLYSIVHVSMITSGSIALVQEECYLVSYILVHCHSHEVGSSPPR